MTASVMPPNIPAHLGRYEVIKRIGKGSMGLVYLARDPVIRRMVALKTFRMELTGSDRELEQYRIRFIREAQSAGILAHPNIVTIHDVVEETETGQVFIAMEYVRGANLKELLDAGERFSMDRIAEIVSQIAAALDYAHEKGVVHRDIKPANIILDDGGRVKVTDFGIARLDSSDLTQEGQLLGTPNYMSPEQVLTDSLDHRTDIFSLGVLLYELVTIHKPFQGHNFTSVSHKIVYEDFAPPEQYVPDLPGEVRSVFEQALAKKPDDRFQQAGELADDLLLSTRLLHDPVSGQSGEFKATEGFILAGEELEPADPSPAGSAADDSATSFSSTSAATPAGTPAPTAQMAEPVVVVTRERRDRRELIEEFGRRLVDLFAHYVSPVLTRRLAIAVAVVMALGVAAGMGTTWIGSGDATASEMPADHQARLAWVPEVRDARIAFSRGDPAVASLLLAQVEGNSGADRPGVIELRRAVQEQLEEIERIQRDATRIDRGLERAQRALEERRYDEASRLAEAVLVVAPGQAEAMLIADEARAAMESEAPTNKARPRTPPVSRSAKGTTSKPRTPTGGRSTRRRSTRISLVFRSEQPEGLIVISSGTKQVFRETFSLERTGVFKRRASGLLEREFEVPAGSGALRIHVTGQRGEASSTVVEGDFSPDGELRLVVVFSRSGDLEASVE